MSNVTAFPDMAAIREEAALWVARVDRGLKGTEPEELNAWLENPLHFRAFEEFGGIWDRTEVLSVLADVFPRQTMAPPAPARRTVSRGWVAATGLAACVAAALFFVGPRIHSGAAPAATLVTGTLQVFSTTTGQRDSQMLPDGSLLSLNTDSEVAVDMSAGRRELRLRRGEAHFEVAHDAARPFIVTVGDHAVRAVGTAFNIRRRGDSEADVLVTSGTVNITGDANSATLNAGQLLALRADGTRRITTLNAEAVESQLAWRRGVLIFDGQTLAQAIAEIDRYTPKHIRLAEQALGEKRIVGYFPTDDMRQLLQSLQANFGVAVTEDDTQILLSARPARAPP